jgi:hypothetical protein
VKVHLLIECWGDRLSDLSVTPYADRAHAEEDWAACIEQDLDGSDRNVEEVISEARRKFCYNHGSGFIALETREVQEPL